MVVNDISHVYFEHKMSEEIVLNTESDCAAYSSDHDLYRMKAPLVSGL